MTVGTDFAWLNTQGVRIAPRLDGTVLRLTMSGSVDGRDPGAVFDPYWTTVDQAARREGITEIELDIRELEYMNSSGLLTLVRWLMKVREQTAYAIVIRYDRDHTWQKTSVPVLAKLAPGVVRVVQP